MRAYGYVSVNFVPHGSRSRSDVSSNCSVESLVMPKETWVKSRRIVINGHPTSLRLEPEFWYWLREIGAECGISATKLIAAINTARNPDRSLSSALRVAVAGYYHNAAPCYGLVDPSSRLAFRIERPRKSRNSSKRAASQGSRTNRMHHRNPSAGGD